MKIVVILITLCLPAALCAQAPEADQQRIHDDLTNDPFPDADENYEDEFENLMQLMSTPYDLNTVSSEELRSLFILTDLQLNNLVVYRKEFGPLLDISELQAVDSFDSTTIEKLRPYVRIRDPDQKLGMARMEALLAQRYLVVRYGRSFKSEDDESGMQGSADKLYYRFRSLESGRFSAGITGEKDAGEKIVFEPRRGWWGMDFHSYHIQFRRKGFLSNIIAGDFQAQFGQGLVAGGAFGLGKGAESVVTVRKPQIGFTPHTSIRESGFYRGVAMTLNPARRIEISIFFSSIRRDASTDSLTVRSFQESGLHRTTQELSARRAVPEKSGGLVIKHTAGTLVTGWTISGNYFGMPIKRDPNLYNQYVFSGDENVNTSLFINFSKHNVSWFGEVAQTIRGGRALVAGSMISAGNKFDLAVVYRNYARNYHSFRARSFGESNEPVNERGTYWGWKYKPWRKFSLSGYVDMFSFPWLGFRRYAPSSGHEWLMRANYQPSKTALVFLQVREESKARNRSPAGQVHAVSQGQRRNAILHCEWGAGRKLTFRTRLQANSYTIEGQTTHGAGIAQDLIFTVGRLKVSARHAIFDAEHFDNRMYFYERDAWLSYSLPAYSGSGVRNYVLIEAKLLKNLTIWARWARTITNHTPVFGYSKNGLNEIRANDVKFQARIVF